ncbi:outer membrane protein [Pararhodobacter marinus]|uniref:outer membrane protein n=1 Tax=Pararhodobacter marinus TaxID=2184063 RepID=UPI0035190181
MSRTFLLSLTVSASALTLCAGSALASGPVMVSEPVSLAAPISAERGWAGFYAGLSYSAVAGAALNSRMIADFDDTTGFGGFLGYNWQRGGFVFGGELSYVHFGTTYWLPYVHQGDSVELRARAGYDFGRIMAYGFVGAARSELTMAYGMGGTPDAETGYVWGLGAEMMMTERMSVGLELARREVYLDQTSGLGAQIDTATLRVGFRF